MPQLTSASNLSEIVALLRDEPELLGLAADRINIAVTFSSMRKRYTDFHRLDVIDWHGHSHRFWLRTIKNKPAEVAADSLTMQYRVQAELFAHLRRISVPDLELTCCEPVSLLTEFNSIITKECRGQLFNDYLVRRLPFLRSRDLLKTFQNVGIWLKVYHASYREELPSGEHAELVRQFEEQFKRPLQDDQSFATLCHFDYSPRNIFVGRDFIQVIDFVGVAPGIAQADIEFFCKYVRESRFNGLYTQTQKENLVAAFLDGYTNFEMTEPLARQEPLQVYANIGA